MESGFNVTDKKRDTPLKKVRIKCDRQTDRHDMTYNYTYVTANLDIQLVWILAKDLANIQTSWLLQLTHTKLAS